VLGLAVVAYHFLEGWEWIDSLLFAVATITTLGFADLIPRTFWGKIFTIVYILVGVSVGIYLVYTLAYKKVEEWEENLGNVLDKMRRRRV